MKTQTNTTTQATLLRTLARKSVLDFGKYEGRTVQQMLDLKNYRALRWYYYNYSKISFMPDILEEIGIPDGWRIPKPGKDPEKNESLNRWKEQNVRCYLGRLSEDDATDAIIKGRKVEKQKRQARNRRAAGFERDDRRNFSKGRMKQRNHGHF